MISVEYIEQINRTAAVELATEGHAYLFAHGLCDPVTQVAWDNSAILGRVKGGMAGVITFNHTKWAKQLNIHIGYVREGFRRSGVYRAMWDELVVQARRLEAVTILGNTHVDNAAMRATARSLGRREVAVILQFAVPPL